MCPYVSTEQEQNVLVKLDELYSCLKKLHLDENKV